MLGREPVGGLIGVAAVTLIEPLLPLTLAFAAAAMLFVISSEIIPETTAWASRSRAPSA
jgi:zinc transporter, ZIP family